MPGDLETELWLRLNTLRARFGEHLEFVQPLDRLSERRVNEEAVRTSRWVILDQPPPPSFCLGDRYDRVSLTVIGNIKSNLFDLQIATDELRQEVGYDGGLLQQEGRHIKRILLFAQFCRAFGLPVEVAPRIVRFLGCGFLECRQILQPAHSSDTLRLIYPPSSDWILRRE